MTNQVFEARSCLTFIAPVFRVADLNRSVSFYRDQLGFEIEFCYEGFYAGVCRDGCHVHLKRSGALGRDQQAFEAREDLDVCVGVTDAEALCTRFSSAGVHFSVPLRNMPYGTEFYVRDPDGYILGFLEAKEAS